MTPAGKTAEILTMIDTKLAKISSVGEAKASLTKGIQSLNSLSDETELSYVDPTVTDNLLHRIETLALSLRSALFTANGKTFTPIDNRRFPEAIAISENRSAPYDNLIDVSIENDALKIVSPLTIGRHNTSKSVVKNYDLNKYIRSRLIKFSLENPSAFKRFSPEYAPFVIVVTRYHTNPSSRNLVDNDNAENSRTVNEIFNLARGSDNGVSLDVYSRVRRCNSENEIRTEFLMFPLRNLDRHLDDLR